MEGPHASSWVNLYWIPLGAGHHSVRLNGLVYEALRAALERRPRRDLFHAVLELVVDGRRSWVEMTPAADDRGADERGVVARGAVGLRRLGALRVFRYEIRRWPDGVVPDLDFAVASPVRVTDDATITRRVFDLLPAVPRHVWGRDVVGIGDLWTCNSVVSWTLATAGLDLLDLPLPPGGRAPGWDAGQVAARGLPTGVSQDYGVHHG